MSMKDWVSLALPELKKQGKNILQKLDKKMPHTIGMARRWKDDLIDARLQPQVQKIECHAASKNLQRDFKKAADPKKSAVVAVTYEDAKQRLDKRKEDFAKKAVQNSRSQTPGQSHRIDISRSR